VENTYLSTFQVLGALGLLLGTFGLGAVLLRNVNERRGELAVLRAVGWPRMAMAVLVVSETIYLLLLGLIAGVLAAGIAILPGLRGGGPRWVPLAAALGAVLAAGVLSSALAVAVVLRVPLLAALRRD
jgi:putative ABC transport system permease protein